MNEEELKGLIGKYYSGISTDEDEKVLRTYFRENSAPPGYEAEKEMFGFFMEAGEVPEPSYDFEARIKEAIDNSSYSGWYVRIRKLLVPLLSAAAGLLILAGSYFLFVQRIEPKDTFRDPESAYAETMKILMDVSSQMNHGTRPLKSVGKINEMKIRSLKSINKSAALVEKNLKSLAYLRNSGELKDSSNEKINNQK
jgi:hypothetical protein